MSDIGSGTPQQDVDKFIIEALKAWEEYGFKDMSFWETFQYDFKDFTEEDFKSASIHNIRKLRDYLRKFGVWIRKQEKYNIARALYEALLEEEPTDWTEEELVKCKDKEDFASFQISRLYDTDFGRKTKISTTGPPPAATSPAPFASPSPTPGPSGQSPANTPIYPMQPSGTGPTPAAAYMQPPSKGFPPAAHMPPGTGRTPAGYIHAPGAGPSPAAYMQPSDITPVPAYAQPSGIGYTSAPHATLAPLATPAPYATPGEYMQPSGPTSAAYVQAPGTGPTLAAYTPPGTGPTPTMLNTSIGHGRELSNLAKIYTDDATRSLIITSRAYQAVVGP